MSADDYIYVLESPSECTCGADEGMHDGNCAVAWGHTEFRVKHVLGAYWDNEDEMVSEFCQPGIPVFYDKGSALIRAHDMAAHNPPEYGVQVVRTEQSVLRLEAQDV